MKQVILDTGPLVAFLNHHDSHHNWMLLQMAIIQPPLLTFEPVIAEACFLLRCHSKGARAVMELIL